MITKTRVMAILTVLALVLVACNISTTGKTRQPVVRASSCQTDADCQDIFGSLDVWCTSQACNNGACEYEDTCGWLSTCCVDALDGVWCESKGPQDVFNSDPCEGFGDPAIP